jgi:hypothetical protein
MLRGTNHAKSTGKHAAFAMLSYDEAARSMASTRCFGWYFHRMFTVLAPSRPAAETISTAKFRVCSILVACDHEDHVPICIPGIRNSDSAPVSLTAHITSKD